uniref:Uncharacterized protein n=1 Tax=Chromera velia CCMP2878 TaxID=1169474 RepID=A0A0G4GLF0_9ALVE|eukprot:Cvel_22417.t1-p1 / transcript=Cvel_22417.t1 / gene=Cvel_22417 / organism=Chromera_velia_CCMP2878 / gene_product=E3 ubiquitin-protein ligase HERC2, putative / transcript_product=E3 ubiquitin-protein ligase HERC2, putative / location=Cvel_scaffold2200:7829-11001(+) / protein_length=967 / sequence_SO=supercontig / SO=protein_coding / is_pseudo=false
MSSTSASSVENRLLEGLCGDLKKDQVLLKERLTGLQFERRLLEFVESGEESLQLSSEECVGDRSRIYRLTGVGEKLGLSVEELTEAMGGNVHLKRKVVEVRRKPEQEYEQPSAEVYDELRSQEELLSSRLGELTVCERVGKDEPAEIPFVWLEGVHPLRPSSSSSASSSSSSSPVDSESEPRDSEEVALLSWHRPADGGLPLLDYQLCLKPLVLFQDKPSNPPYNFQLGVRLPEDGRWEAVGMIDTREATDSPQKAGKAAAAASASSESEEDQEGIISKIQAGEISTSVGGDQQCLGMHFDGFLGPGEPAFFLFTPSPSDEAISVPHFPLSPSPGDGSSAVSVEQRERKTGQRVANEKERQSLMKGVERHSVLLPGLRDPFGSRQGWPFEGDPTNYSVPLVQGAARGWWVWLRAKNEKGWGAWPQRPRLILLPPAQFVQSCRSFFDGVCYWGQDWEDLVRTEHFHHDGDDFDPTVRDSPAQLEGEWDDEGVVAVATGLPATLIVGRKGGLWQLGGVVCIENEEESEKVMERDQILLAKNAEKVVLSASGSASSVPFRTRLAASGHLFCAAVSCEGDLAMWGRSEFGECGVKRKFCIAPSRPALSVLSTSLSVPVVQIACGWQSVLCLDAFGQPWTWGAQRSVAIEQRQTHLQNIDKASNPSEDGGLEGPGGTRLPGPPVPPKVNHRVDWNTQSVHQLKPRLMTDFLPNKVVAVACGPNFDGAVTEDGRMWTWGLNVSSVLGHGEDLEGKVEFWTPRRVETRGNFEAAPIVWMSFGSTHSTCVDADGRVFVWGDNSRGQLGLGRGVEGEGKGGALDSAARLETVNRPTALTVFEGGCAGVGGKSENLPFRGNPVCLRTFAGVHSTHFVMQDSQGGFLRDSKEGGGGRRVHFFFCGSTEGGRSGGNLMGKRGRMGSASGPGKSSKKDDSAPYYVAWKPELIWSEHSPWWEWAQMACARLHTAAVFRWEK